jgi:outer membrane protein
LLKKVLLACLGLLVFVSFCDAADTVGVIESRKVLFQHPGFDAAAKALVELRRQKESETNLAAEGESDPNKKLDMFRAVAREMAEAEERLMSPVRKDCEDALIAVMQKRKITVVLEKDSVYIGGTDITEDVIRQLKVSK